MNRNHNTISIINTSKHIISITERQRARHLAAQRGRAPITITIYI